MKKLKCFKPSDIFIGIIFTLLLISLGVIITINFRSLYYLDIKILNIERTSGIPREEIVRNYDALIDYSSPFFRGDLKFPSLEASTSGLQHFKEVKDIFTAFYIMAALTMVAAILIVIYKSRKKDISYLAVSSITAIVLPAVLGALIMSNFDKAFILFHKMFFRNDLWIFDPMTDPVINILPDTFFLHCAMLIIFFVILGSIGLFIAYLIIKSRSSIRYRKVKGLKI